MSRCDENNSITKFEMCLAFRGIFPTDTTISCYITITKDYLDDRQDIRGGERPYRLIWTGGEYDDGNTGLARGEVVEEEVVGVVEGEG